MNILHPSRPISLSWGAILLGLFNMAPVAHAQLKDPAAFNRKAAAQRRHIDSTQAMLRRGPWLAQAKEALPQPFELPGYAVKILGESGTRSLIAARIDDRASLRIFVSASSNAAVVKRVCSMNLAGDVMGPLPKGSPSGKQLGEQSWQSWGSQPNSTARQPSYFLQVQDGPSVIGITFGTHIGQDKEGHIQWKPITQDDWLQVEHVARLMLGKLRKLNLTHDTFHPAKPKGR